MANRLSLEGKTFGRLTVVRLSHKDKRGVLHWHCRCSCGREVVKQGSALNRGRVQSCGCIAKERLANQGTHNHCKRGEVSPTWQSWRAMHTRCKPSHKSRQYYYDRGITVCDRWIDFNNFLEDMGERPDGTTLDRIDNDQGYCKDNCRWATTSTQQLNKGGTRLYTYQGESKTLTEWAQDNRCAVPYCTLYKRVVVYKFDFIDSLTKPSRRTS